MNKERFARRCDATGKGMNHGWVVGPMELYIADEENLIVELRKVDDVPDGLSDDELREYLYDEGYFYYTEWEAEYEIKDQGYYYTEDGKEIEL